MFAAIKNLSASVNAINENDAISQVLSDSKVEAKIIQLNDEQLSEGKYPDGKYLPDYSPVSVEVFGKAPGPMTLYNTGEYRSEIYVQAQSDSVVVKDMDWKADMLQKKYGDPYGETILGVNEKLPELRAFIRPMLIQNLKAKIFRK